jgi:hypothetical protein
VSEGFLFDIFFGIALFNQGVELSPKVMKRWIDKGNADGNQNHDDQHLNQGEAVCEGNGLH